MMQPHTHVGQLVGTAVFTTTRVRLEGLFSATSPHLVSWGCLDTPHTYRLSVECSLIEMEVEDAACGLEPLLLGVVPAIPASRLSMITLDQHAPRLTIRALLSFIHEAENLDSLRVIGASFDCLDADHPVECSLVTSYVTNVQITVASDVLGCILRSICLPFVETLTLVGATGWFPLAELFIHLVCTLPTLAREGRMI